MDKKSKKPINNRRIENNSLSCKGRSYSIGIFVSKKYGGKLFPCHRKDKSLAIDLDGRQSKCMRDNDIIIYKIKKTEFHFIKNLGQIDSCKIFSTMAAYAYDLRQEFNQESLELSNSYAIPSLDNRLDFRNIPLITIDGRDAKDFDDAVYVEQDNDPKNSEGWKAIVAIADVSFYVRPNDAIDEEAKKRGNSVYFADKVIPMLPERLSNDLCSLRPHEDRACLAVEMIISHEGKLKSFFFRRVLIKSHARLTYDQVENAIHGKVDEITKPLVEKGIIKSLYGCYLSLRKARDRRGTINVDSSENSFTFNEDGSVRSIKPKKRLESHKIIEELMIIANVAAAKTLKAKDWPGVYRIHEQPNHLKLRALQTTAKNFNVSIRKFSATNTTQVINELLDKVADKDYSRMFNELILRSQAQAKYSPHNIGHFGLNLAYYSHFTSPIRRYADLLVHRALVECLGFEKKTINICTNDELFETCEHISKTERTAMEAEREVQDRFMAHYLKNYIGEVFDGIIVGVGIHGIFVELQNIGAQGFIPKSSLPQDFYIFDEEKHRYLGKRTKRSYCLGDKIKIQITNADPVTCSIGFTLYNDKNHNLKKQAEKHHLKSKSDKKQFFKKNIKKKNKN